MTISAYKISIRTLDQKIAVCCWLFSGKFAVNLIESTNSDKD